MRWIFLYWKLRLSWSLKICICENAFLHWHGMAGVFKPFREILISSLLSYKNKCLVLLHELGHYIDNEIEIIDPLGYESLPFYAEYIEEKADLYGLLLAIKYGIEKEFRDNVPLKQDILREFYEKHIIS